MRLRVAGFPPRTEGRGTRSGWSGIAMVGVRRVLVWLAAFGLAGAWLAVSAPSATAVSQKFLVNGEFTVPAGVCQVTIAAWGGGGDASGGDGGRGVGGRIQANFAVTGPQVLQVFVGMGGDGGFNAGGAGSGDGGNGGGSSAVEQGSTVLIVAGGGGGGGDATDGGHGGFATATGPTDAGKGQDGLANGANAGGAGGTAQGTPGSPTVDAIGNGGGGGAGANPGAGATAGGAGADAGGGGGGNLTTSTAGLTDPGTISGFDGQVIITTAAPGVGCATTPTTPTTAPAAGAVVVTPRFTG